jgi:hypothetical protein
MLRRAWTILGATPIALLACAIALTWAAPAFAQDAPTIRNSGSAANGGTQNGTQPTASATKTTPGQPVNQAGQAPVRIVLSYSDHVLKQIDASGGGLVGGVNAVAKMIESAGLGPDIHAMLVVEITPRYERLASDLYTAKLDVGAPNLQIDGRIKAPIQAKLQAEARTFLVRLKSWSHPLSEGERRALLGYTEKVDIAIVTPFQHIKTWSFTPANVSLRLLTLKKPRPILNYVALDANGERETLYELPVGQAFWIEARYISLPSGTTQTAELNWGSGSIQVPLQATDQLLLFRAGPYYIVPPASPSPDGGAHDGATP